MKKKKIIIVGNGFASLFFIQYFLLLPVLPVFVSWLYKLFSKHEITLIGNGQFIYFPSIPDFITGHRNREKITVDIEPYLKRRNIKFVDDMVTDIQDGGRTVITTKGRYSNDALFLGIGPAFLKNDIPGTVEYTYSPCSGIDDMERFLEKLNTLKQGTIYLGFKLNKEDGFVAGRGGQIYETACLLDYELKKRGVREHFNIHLFSPNIEVNEKGAITDLLLERNIILDYGYEPKEFIEGGMLDANGTFRQADIVLFSPGIVAPELAVKSCLPVSVGGHIDVDQYGQVKGLENVFSAGDCANHEHPTPWLPHQAHMAQLRSQAAAKNMREVLNKDEATHTYRKELSCILNMGNDGLWLHAAEDNKPPLWNLFPKRSKKLVTLKSAFEKLYLLYLKYL
ncbi:NAD(P)/FAD-dependent oxidoreductase [Thiomicrorhabdus arctica]|uniref:NAD(P)/FAD-dependent oxidoreductase n=1 Tax=Thiomicrorhabdus arctica TaxID=131540 RepID=UPI0003614D6B|nr:FAD-dependent oxidoreductase [Thiomicrorhabdus arctica]